MSTLPAVELVTVNNATAGAVKEWHYPNGTRVPRPDANVNNFYKNWSYSST